MKTKTLLACLIALIALVGCGSGSGGSSGPDAKSDAAKLDVATKARAYFDKAHGDYNALSAQDKADYVKLLGGEKAATDLWATMRGPGAPSGQAASASGPPGSTTGPR